MHHRMGAVYLLALVRSCVPGARALDVYPAVMAWGTLLNVAGVVLLCRWAFRLPRAAAVATGFIAAIAASSLSFAQHFGFLCQVYGTAALAFALAVLARCRWRASDAGLFAVASCGLVSLYSELSPVLAVACLAYVVVAGARAWKTGRTAALTRFAGLTVLAIVVVGNVELVRAFRAVQYMTGLHGVGWHIDYSALRFWAFAVGADFLGTVHGPAQIVAVVFASLTLLLGLLRMRQAPVAVTLLTLAGLAVFYTVWARDPWTHLRGHTWNLFKLAQWSFPLVAALQGAGLHRLLAGRNGLLAVICAICLCASYPAHARMARQTTVFARQSLGSKQVLGDARELRRRLRRLHPGSLCLLGEPEGFHPRSLVPYLVAPRPFVNGWWGSAFWMAGMPDRWGLVRPDTLYLMHGAPPFEPPLERLPLNFSVVDGSRPLVFRMSTHAGGVRLDVFAPCPGLAMLVLAWHPDAGPVGLLRVQGPSGCHQQVMGTTGPTHIPVSLPGGTTRLVLRRADGQQLRLARCELRPVGQPICKPLARGAVKRIPGHQSDRATASSSLR
jgi:hypothetical protein